MKDEGGSDDDLELDASLSSMRSMWRELRDEEPSDRGMAALLAAARVQADEMKPKKASWWSQLLEQLRRPPVLAMATVVVLIGGAVVISQRDDMKTSAETTETAMTPPPPAPIEAPAGAAAPAVEPAPPSAARDEGTLEEGGAIRRSARSPSNLHGPLTDPAPRPRPVAPIRERTPDPVPSDGLAEKQKAQTRGAVDKRAAQKQDSTFDVAPGAPMKESESLEIAVGGDSDDLQAKGTPTTPTTSDKTSATTGAAPVQAGPTPDSVARQPLPSIEGEDRKEESSVAQLVTQCEAAAARNDCTAVRALAQKIATRDPQLYRTRLVKNANVARCLPTKN